MITENQVVDAVRRHLIAHGWTVLSYAHGQEHGHDVHAELGSRQLIVEAKGETSGTLGTARFGKPFTYSQIATHVPKAIYVGMAALESGIEAAIAFPDTSNHRNAVGQVSSGLDTLGIKVFWVDAGGSVTI